MKKRKNKNSITNFAQSTKRTNITKSSKVQSDEKNRIIVYLGVVTIITAIVFFPSMSNGFVNWDDEGYVVNNLDIKGFSIGNIIKVFSSTYASNYQPLTMFSYMLDYQMFQLNPMGFHGVNVLWHIATCLIVFVLIYSLSGKTITSLIASLLFAIHPLRVESVAWVAERKDVMSAFFFFLSLLFYVRYLKLFKRSLYNLAIVSFFFSLLCKPMAVSLPLVLLLICYFMNGRPDKKAIKDSLPFFAIAAVFALVTLFTQNVLAPIGTDTFSLSIIQRICIPFFGILFYIAKTFLPINLCSLYPFPANAETSLIILFSPFIATGFATILILFKIRSRTFVFGLFFYIFTLLPVLQIIPVGNAMVAERYSYIPCMGIFFLFSSLLQLVFNEKLKNQKNVRLVLGCGIFFIVIVLSCLSFARCSIWKDSLTLWNDVVAKFPVDAAYYFRGLAYSEVANYPRAIDDFNQAIEKNHANALAFDARGTVFFKLGQLDNALQDYTEAIKIVPKNAMSYGNRATIYSQKGDFAKAIVDYSEAITIYPKGAFACYCNRGMAYGNIGDYNRAIDDFSEAIKLYPKYMQVYYYRGLAYKAKGDYNLAMDDMKTACNLGFNQACKMMNGN